MPILMPIYIRKAIKEKAVISVAVSMNTRAILTPLYMGVEKCCGSEFKQYKANM